MASIILTVIVYSLQINTMLAFGAVVGSSVFFITHGFKQNAEKSEKKLLEKKSIGMPDYLKNGVLYSILALGVVMLTDDFGIHVPSCVSPVIAFAIVGYFFWESFKHPSNKQISGKKIQE